MIKILMIDDSETDCNLFKIFLKRNCHDLKITIVNELNDLQEVLKYDAIVIDKYLQTDVDGVQLSYNIHNLTDKIPIMLISGSQLDKEYLNFCDIIANKNDLPLFDLECNRFIRQLKRLDDLKNVS